MVEFISNYARNRRIYKALAHPFRTLNVDVDQVRFKVSRDDGKFSRIPKGSILDGDWDLNIHEIDIAANPKYRAIRERFVEGMPWEETTLFKEIYRRRLDANQAVQGCGSLAELVRRYERRHDRIYESIKRDSVLKASLFGPDIQPIYVFVGRNGEFLWHNGNHRLYMAKILRVKQIPVRVWARHRQWQEIREEVASEGRVPAGSPGNHADLRDLLARRSRNLSRWFGRLVIIGCVLAEISDA